MAAAAHVSDETLYNWHTEGCPCEVAGDGTRRWDKAKVLAWREKHRPDYQLKGGKRQGAGRKRGMAGRMKAMVAVGGDVIQRDHVGGHAGEDAGGTQLGLEALITDEVKRRADQIVDGWGEMKGLMALVTSGGLTAIQSATLAKAVEAQAAHLKLQKERAELVEAADVKATWSAALAKVREVMNQTPDRAAAKVVSECGLKASQLHAVRRVVEDEMRRACEVLVKALGEEENKAQSTEHK